MKRSKLQILVEKKIPVYILLLTLFVGAFITVSFGAAIRHIVLNGPSLHGVFADTLLTVAKFPALVKEVLTEVPINRRGGRQVIEARILPIPGERKQREYRFSDLDGFKKSGRLQAGALEDKGYLLLSSYDKDKEQATVQLIRIADQQILHEWAPDIDAILSLSDTKRVKSSTRILHPLLLEDGGLVFQNSGSPLFKINSSSSVEWFIKGYYHHSIEQDAEGNIWACSSMIPPSYAGILIPADDRAIAQISPAGEVLFQKFVAKILEENGYSELLASGSSDLAIHLNDIQPALADSKFWKKGDLLLSMRVRNTIALYRPSTDKIVWSKTGPWAGQHDVDFISDHQISVFGNDIIWVSEKKVLKRGDHIKKPKNIQTVLINGHNNVYIYDFSSDTVTTPYKKSMKSMEVRTLSEGLAEVLPNGDVFIEESNYSRILRLTPDTAKWEFVRRVGKNLLSLTSWSRYLNEEQVQKVLPKLQNVSHN